MAVRGMCAAACLLRMAVNVLQLRNRSAPDPTRWAAPPFILFLLGSATLLGRSLFQRVSVRLT
jgi:hypothetical protein